MKKTLSLLLLSLLSLQNIDFVIEDVFASSIIKDEFEINLGNWNNLSGQVPKWTIKSGATSSGNTGPEMAAQGNYYIYCETSSPNYPNKVFELESIELNKEGGNIEFDYSMYGATVGSLELLAYTGAAWVNIWIMSGNKGSYWNRANIDYSANTSKLKFRYTSGSSYTGDTALDYIVITESEAVQSESGYSAMSLGISF